jgi:MFS family permease
VIRLAVALFAVQAGFHGFTAALPVALARAGMPDPQIGLIVGIAALVQIPAAFLAGVIVDRLGGIRAFVGAGIAYLAGCAILLAPGVEPGGSPWPFALARVFQGIGIAATLPAALSLVPRLVAPARRGFGLAFVGSAHNLTLVVIPPLSLAVLALTSLHGVALLTAGIVVAGITIVLIAPLRYLADGVVGAGPTGPSTVARRRLGFAYRSTWASLIAIDLLFITHWGVVVGFLPQRAEAAGADIAVFFIADGIVILLSRVPTGWLVDRVRPIVPIALGLAGTSVAIVLLAMPPTTPLLAAAGCLTGAGGALVITPLLVEMSRRSADADRGSAFSILSAANATALAIGSIGGAAVVAIAGFETAILATLLGMLGGAVVAGSDAALRMLPTRGTALAVADAV